MTIAPGSITAFLRSLRSVRRFSAVPIPDDVLFSILEVGRWTGSGKNRQPWDIVVVRERATLEALSRTGQFADHLAGAAAAFALIMQGSADAFDAGRLTERLCLAAWAHGVGSAIASVYPEHAGEARCLLGVPEDRWLHDAVSLGYPAAPDALLVATTPRVARALPSIGRRDLDDVVSWEHYGRRRS